MNQKPKKVSHKKVLVRNTSTNPSKASLITKTSDQTNSLTKCARKSASVPSVPPSQQLVKSKDKETFETPELNSVLKLAKKIKAVENVKPKSLPALDSNRLSVDEKVTRLMNFPYDQPIFKDLIPIETREVTPAPVSSRPPLPQKDKKPVLSDFFQPRKCREYYFLPRHQQEKVHPLAVRNDNLRVYKVLQLAYDNNGRIS